MAPNRGSRRLNNLCFDWFIIGLLSIRNIRIRLDAEKIINMDIENAGLSKQD